MRLLWTGLLGRRPILDGRHSLYRTPFLYRRHPWTGGPPWTGLPVGKPSLDRKPLWTEGSLGRRPLGRRPSLDRTPFLDRRLSEQEAHLDRVPPGQEAVSVWKALLTGGPT